MSSRKEVCRSSKSSIKSSTTKPSPKIPIRSIVLSHAQQKNFQIKKVLPFKEQTSKKFKSVVKKQSSSLKEFTPKSSSSYFAGRKQPSFGEYDLIAPKECEFLKIVKSKRQDDEENVETPYDYLEPLGSTASGTIAFKELFFSNVFLSVLLLLLWSLWIFLFVMFRRMSTETYFAPHGQLPDMQTVCQIQVVEMLRKYKIDLDPDCFYHKFRYPANCLETVCSTVYLQANVTANLNLSEYAKWLSLHPINEEISIPVPNFVPCAADSWCFKGKCLPVDDKRVTDYNEISKTKINGDWKRNCKNDDMKCIYDISGYQIKDQLFKSCHVSEGDLEFCFEENDKFFCYTLCASVQFNIKSCTAPMPKYGGQPCWGNDVTSNIAHRVIVADKFCECETWDLPDCFCEDHIKQKIVSEIDSCNVNLLYKNETVSMPYPREWSCQTVDGRSGFCVWGTCAPDLSSEEHCGGNLTSKTATKLPTKLPTKRPIRTTPAEDLIPNTSLSTNNSEYN